MPLRPVLRLEPTLGLNFIVADKMDERLLLQHVTGLTRLYESVWPDMRAGRSDAGQPAPAEFFSLRTLVRPDPGRALECPYIVTFTTSPPMEQFRVLVLHNTTVAGDEVPIVLLEEDYPRPQPQAENDDRMEVNVEEIEADDDSDGSSLTALSDDEEV
ncbi:hypothetical protein QFC22_002053 [Naganishia vaughanmartiniae]|uniref:Uncharacterized protein n=1 Tax=Naganishia vaughanmartiniae TaxID=1424756 RepID=A0ACC2XGW1_9TREE|nr:hypothetical protein QFC22_002053 [Naganishia vaughanmartiniae]